LLLVSTVKTTEAYDRVVGSDRQRGSPPKDGSVVNTKNLIALCWPASYSFSSHARNFLQCMFKVHELGKKKEGGANYINKN
jgi:hypothetical protein